MITRGQAEAYVREHGQYLYHCTPYDRIESIMAEGLGGPSMLTERYDPSVVRDGAVYLCNAWTAINVGITSDGDWGDTVFAVRLLDLDLSLLVGDEDNYRTADLVLKDTSAAAVRREHPYMDDPDEVFTFLSEDLGTCAYAGRIQPSLLTLVHHEDLNLMDDEQRYVCDALIGSGLGAASRRSRKGDGVDRSGIVLSGPWSLGTWVATTTGGTR